METSAGARTCLVILGMHRSGTSALTRVLSFLGVDLPSRPIGPGVGNPTGHWEPQPLVGINERLLNEAGSRWDDWRSFDPNLLPRERIEAYRREISVAIEDEYGTSPYFLLKDPRVCRFVPFYEDILKSLGVEARYVLCVREPRSVAASLEVRDGMDEASALLLWMRHVLDSERWTRSATRVVVSYEALLANTERVQQVLALGLHTDWPRAFDSVRIDVEDFLRPELNHARSIGMDDGPMKHSWVNQVRDAIETLASEPFNQQAMSLLDRVRNQFEPLSDLFGTAGHAEVQRRRAQVAELEQQVAELEQKVELEHNHAVAAEQEVASVLNSRSWRVTAPLRRANAAIRPAWDSYVQPIRRRRNGRQ